MKNQMKKYLNIKIKELLKQKLQKKKKKKK